MSISMRNLSHLSECVHDQELREETGPHPSERKTGKYQTNPDNKLCGSFDLDLDPDEIGF